MDYLCHLASLNATKKQTNKKTTLLPSKQQQNPKRPKTSSGFPFCIISDKLGKIDISRKQRTWHMLNIKTRKKFCLITTRRVCIVSDSHHYLAIHLLFSENQELCRYDCLHQMTVQTWVKNNLPSYWFHPFHSSIPNPTWALLQKILEGSLVVFLSFTHSFIFRPLINIRGPSE